VIPFRFGQCHATNPQLNQVGFGAAYTNRSESAPLKIRRPTVFPYGCSRLQEDARNQGKGFALLPGAGCKGWRSFAFPPRCPTASSVRPVMTTRAEHLRQQARKVALKAAGAKELAMKASLREEQKQLLMLAEQAEKDEQNRMGLPPRGLTKK
jgi:hypothetical protein